MNYYFSAESLWYMFKPLMNVCFPHITCECSKHTSPPLHAHWHFPLFSDVYHSEISKTATVLVLCFNIWCPIFKSITIHMLMIVFKSIRIVSSSHLKQNFSIFQCIIKFQAKFSCLVLELFYFSPMFLSRSTMPSILGMDTKGL